MLVSRLVAKISLYPNKMETLKDFKTVAPFQKGDTYTTPVIGLLAAMHLHLVSCNGEPNQEEIVQIILQIIIHSFVPGFRKAKGCWVPSFIEV